MTSTKPRLAASSSASAIRNQSNGLSKSALYALIREELTRAAEREAAKAPFNLYGRGHETRVTLDVKMAAILKTSNLPRVTLAGWGTKTFYPARVFTRAARTLQRRLGWSPFGSGGGQAVYLLHTQDPSIPNHQPIAESGVATSTPPTQITPAATVSPWNPEPPAPVRAGRFPYLVIRFMAAVYQREDFAIHVGSERIHIGHRDSFIHHPRPFEDDGTVSPECRQALIAAVLAAVRKYRFRMCIVWAPGKCTFVEADGSANDSTDPPSGGIGTGGVGGAPLPSDIEFDRRVQLAAATVRTGGAPC